MRRMKQTRRRVINCSAGDLLGKALTTDSSIDSYWQESVADQ